MDIILVHPREAEHSKKHIMHLEPNHKPELRLQNGKNSSIEKEEGGHCTAVMPVWGVKNVDVEKHDPYHRSLITLLLPAQLIKQAQKPKYSKTQYNFVKTTALSSASV